MAQSHRLVRRRRWKQISDTLGPESMAKSHS
jgi:hypothetical protein